MDLRAGAPRFTVKSDYDARPKKVTLNVKQTQKVEGHVGLFRVPVDVAITTAAARKSSPSKCQRPMKLFVHGDGPPLLVLFDKAINSEIPRFQKAPKNGSGSYKLRKTCRTARCGFRAWQHQGQ